MRRILIVGLTCFLASGVASAELVAMRMGTQPAAPRILGPRRTTDRTPTFRFVSHEVGMPAGKLRSRCAIDRAKLHVCPNRYTPTL